MRRAKNFGRRAQAAIEYIIGLAVTIVLVTIVVVALSDLNIFNSVSRTEAAISDIQNLLSDVSFRHTINSAGFVQASIRSVRGFITNTSFSIYSELDEECKMNLGTITSDWIYTNISCPFLNGTVAEAYSLKCIVSYTEDIGIDHNRTGICKGAYEEG